MSTNAAVKTYSPLEETINIRSHAAGLLLSVFGLFLLMARTIPLGNPGHTASAAVFGLSLIVLYGASTLYHSATQPEKRARLRVVDHAAIYVLIAGTYTPFTLITLRGETGWLLFAAAWATAVAGVILKLFFTGRYNGISTLMYVLMGWMMAFAIGPLIDGLPTAGLIWLFAGGLSYTLGAILYSFKTITLGHAIFHICVLIGSISHFVAVFFYVLPAGSQS